MMERGGADWRRNDSPARRVIEGAVPGRRWESRESPRVESAPSGAWRQRSYDRPAPSMRGYGFDRQYKQAPAPRAYEREYRAQPRQYGYRSPRVESRPEVRAPMREYRPQAPRAPQYSAPAPRSESRSAPAPRPSGGFKGPGRGPNKG
jgi:hypothetical protein